jgi:23S rRNA pseudouridine1911/1915/1917 synthase
MTETTARPKAQPVQTITAEGDDVGRIDVALGRHFPDAGRKQLAELFDAGTVRLAGKKAKKGDRVAAGDLIELFRLPITKDATSPTPEPEAGAALEILLETPHLVVVYKPAGRPTQPLRAGELGTIANALAARYPECRAIGDDPRDGGLVHRLDIGTSGALIAARDPETYRALRDAFAAGTIEKEYLALTERRPVSTECDAPLAQRGKRVVVDHTDGLPAYTQVVVERAVGGHALVRCLARTGRMHQVRAHLAHLDAPIVGDTLYGGAALPGSDNFFLHAERITFPLDGGRHTINAPIPAEFRGAMTQLDL